MPEIVPAAVLVEVPIFIGDAKLPLASDSCAVKIFPAGKVPEIVNGIETATPAQ